MVKLIPMSMGAGFQFLTAPSGGSWPGQPGNPVGFSNTPAAAPSSWTLGGTWPGAYPGLTPWPGGTGGQTISGGTHATSGSGTSGDPWIFAFYDFNSLTGGVNISGSNMIFVGCRFQSNSATNYNVQLASTAGNVNFFYCTVGPLVSLYTSPPGGAWPSAGALQNTVTQTTNVNCIDGNSGTQYGFAMSSGIGTSTIDHCDIWGWGEGVVYNNSTAQMNLTDCWIHDTANQSPQSYHQDGTGYLNGTAGPSNVLVHHCTIASLGNTNAIAFQLATSGYSNIVVTNNYLTGFSILIDMCHNFNGSSGLVFTDNIVATDVQWIFGPARNVATSFTSTGNLWRRNVFTVIAGTTNNSGATPAWTSANNGNYLWPDNTLNASDWAF